MYECFDDAPQTWLRLAITFAADDTAVLVLVGELDHASVFDLHQALDAIEEAGARCVLIDARDIEFIDCAGVAALERHARRWSSRGRALHLVRPSAVVVRLFDLLGARLPIGA
ncbi:MAG: STAS domain-containing protein [Ilumatobacteraceae bacterium]|nr:STAS domain-containing protein [Acidimicrobiales bacterium]MCB9396013.1 STAS domain-containing protein [Acidimicrobiaceae bacterium]